MNKKQILASLNKIANELDNTGLYKEATSLTYVMKRLAEEELIPEQKVSCCRSENQNLPEQNPCFPRFPKIGCVDTDSVFAFQFH